MSPRFQQSVGQLLVNGEPRGAGWIVTCDFAITAWHCIIEATEADSITLMFDEIQCAVVVVDHDSALDAAILSIRPNGLLPPALQLLARPQDNVHPLPDWLGHGFPNSNGDANQGVTLTGKLTSFHSTYKHAPAIQLNCTEGGNYPDFSYAVFGGMSGGPVVTNLDGEKVVGVIFEAPPPFGEHIIYATPIDAIVHRFSAQLGSIPIASWDRSRRVANIIRDDTGPGLTANIDAEFIEAVWSRGLTGLWCNISPEESLDFKSALARLLIHARSENGTELVFTNARIARSWSKACQEYAYDWVPVSGFQANILETRYTWHERTSGIQPSGGVHFHDLCRFAEVLHGHCDRWVLNYLSERMISFFDENNTVPIASYPIANDILEEMERLWISWRGQLESDSNLLHHFLTLMLTERGDYDCSCPGPGAGPETVDRCIFHPLVFTLAVCSCLPEQLTILKNAQPGNIGDDVIPGHACGIEVINRETLQLALVRHHWATPIVLVPNYPYSWSELRASELHFRQQQGEPEVSLDHDPPREVVISRDMAFLNAIRSGCAALRAHLNTLCRELFLAQQRYEQKSEAN